MEFIFENPIFIIVIIGYIISFFMKNKGNQQQQRKGSGQQVKPSPAEVFKQMQERIPQMETRSIEEQQRHQAEQALKLEMEALERQRLAEEEINALKEQQEMAKKQAEFIKTVSKAPVPIQGALQKEWRQTLSPSKKQLIDGIIWSEIIGPPRALKAHKSVKKQ
ncbi:hypothetical protein V7122_07770 [Bacillus sp. JJ1532]|uniref:hypothetical protein n=1 Tax=unclassified Bacillus (in: firmicutes) TaxID=185979 RepID=UPI003000CFEE